MQALSVLLQLIGGIVVAGLLFMWITSLPWKQWFCTHTFEKVTAGFAMYTWTSVECTKCGKVQ